MRNYAYIAYDGWIIFLICRQYNWSRVGTLYQNQAKYSLVSRQMSCSQASVLGPIQNSALALTVSQYISVTTN
jgi:hypothetical protein